MHGLILCMSVLCILITLQHGVVLQLILFLVLLPLSRSILMVLRGVSSRVHVTAISFNRTSFSLHIKQCLETTVFIDDGAPPHIARQMTALLRAQFGDERVISMDFPTASPSRSPNIKSCDLWL